MLEKQFLNGKYFNIRVDLERSNSRGYYVSNKVVARNRATFLFNIDKDSKKSLLLHSDITKNRLLNFDRLSKLLNLNCLYINLDFDSISFTTKDKEHSITIDYKKTYKKLKINTIYAEFFPVIIDNKTSFEKNRLIFHEAIKNIKLPFDIDEYDYIIFGGELVWSGWLDLLLINDFLSINKFPDSYIKVDNDSIIEMILLSDSNSELWNTNIKSLLPDILFKSIASKDNEIELRHDDNKPIKLFPKHTTKYVYDNFSGWYLNDMKIPVKLMLGIKGFYDNMSKNTTGNINSRASGVIKNHTISLSDDFNKIFFGNADLVESGKIIANKFVNKIKLIKCDEIFGSYEVCVINKQFVKRGDLVLKNKLKLMNITTKEYYSEYEGIVDLSLINQDILIITVSKILIDCKINSESNLRRLDNDNHIELSAKLSTVSIDYYSGKSLLVNEISKYVFKNFEEVNFEKMLLDGIGLIIVLEAQYDQFCKFIDERSYYLNYINLVIVDIINNKKSIDKSAWFNSWQGVVAVANNTIFYNEGHVFEESRQLKSIKSISYDDEIGYYKIVHETENSIVYKNSKDELGEVSNINLIK